MTREDAGAVTAEFAVVLPAIVLVLAACVGGIRLAGEQVRLQDASATGARALARGDPIPGSGGSSLTTRREADLVCVVAAEAIPWAPGLPRIALSAESCALADGR
jgi:hypothetical protein